MCLEPIKPLLPISGLEQLFDIELSVDNSLDINEIKSTQRALYTQLGPSFWLPEDQPPLFVLKEKVNAQLFQQRLNFEKRTFSRMVYIIQGSHLNLVYLQLLPDKPLENKTAVLCETEFNLIMPLCLNLCLKNLQIHAQELKLTSIISCVYNRSLIALFSLAGYQEKKDLKEKNSPVTPHVVMQLLLNNG